MSKAFTCTEHLTQKQERMLNDDEFFDVTEAEVAAFLNRLSRMKYSEDAILRMRKKYDAYIDDARKQMRIRCGLSIDEEYRIVSIPSGKFYIDGYCEELWKMLNIPGFTTTKIHIRNAIQRFEKYGTHDKAIVLYNKYADFLEETQPESELSFDDVMEVFQRLGIEKIKTAPD